MVPSRVRPVEFPVQHVGKPHQRLPSTFPNRCEGPGDGFPRKTAPHIGVVFNGKAVTEVNKPVVGHLPVNREYSREKKQGDQGFNSVGKTLFLVSINVGLGISVGHQTNQWFSSVYWLLEYHVLRARSCFCGLSIFKLLKFESQWYIL